MAGINKGGVVGLASCWLLSAAHVGTELILNAAHTKAAQERIFIHTLNPGLRTVQTKRLGRFFMTILLPLVRRECQMVPCCSVAQLCAAGFNIEPPPCIYAFLSEDMAPELFAHAVPHSLNLLPVDNSDIHTAPRLISFQPS